jgi:dephospho-CoA kinase
VIASIPLLAEAGAIGAYDWLHRVLVVDAPVELQRTRLLQRDGIDPALADAIIESQADRPTRLRLATDVIVNDGPMASVADIVVVLDALFRRISAA